MLIAVGAALAIGLAGEHFGVARLLLAQIGRHAAGWRQVATSHPAAALALFVLAYGAALAAFVPVALVLTFASGALFPPAVGAAASVAGACLGAAVSYGLARYGLKAPLAGPGPGPGAWLAGPRLARLRARVFLTTLAVRLLPLTPFTLFSLAAGAARAAFPAFLAATALGVAPECVAYALLGRRLAGALARGRLPRVGDIVQPGLLIPLAILAALCVGGVFLSAADARPAAPPRA